MDPAVAHDIQSQLQRLRKEALELLATPSLKLTEQTSDRDLHLWTTRNSLLLQSKLLEAIATSPDLHWSPSDEGALHVDPFPNPDRWAIASFGPIKIAIDCGPKGLGVGPGH